MKRIFIKFLTVILVVIVFGNNISLTAVNASPYISYNYDRWGDAVPSQAGYIEKRTVSGDDIGADSFDEPSDIFFDGTDFYIADTGNNRIVGVDGNLENVSVIYEKFKMQDGSFTTLDNPEGVFVSDDIIYIADTQNSRILLVNRECKVITEITKPDSEIYDSSKTFLPERVIADKAGNIYAVLGNITTGCAMFSPQGEFIGFYGSNRVEPTAEAVGNYFRNVFMSDKKKARRKRQVPSGITGFDIKDDFIFTCTASSSVLSDTVKKLNSAGKNIFADRDVSFGDYELKYDTSHYKIPDSSICDIDISENGNINCLDSVTGHIFQYDEDCNLLFIMGTVAEQKGGFKSPSAIESAGENIYVLDSQKNNITVFTETSFGKTVHSAVELYNTGYYAESLDLWYEVLRRDGNYTYAYNGTAFALLRKGDYKNSMKYAKLAGNSELYNKAFKEYRSVFLKENSGKIFTVFIVAVVFMVFLKIRKRGGRRK
ncbi:MAG: hypothetical protein J6B74_04805 [Ruminococcus sp.]|nr:hypothetical protein [Ruminococcus sp.]